MTPVRRLLYAFLACALFSGVSYAFAQTLAGTARANEPQPSPPVMTTPAPAPYNATPTATVEPASCTMAMPAAPPDYVEDFQGRVGPQAPELAVRFPVADARFLRAILVRAEGPAADPTPGAYRLMLADAMARGVALAQGGPRLEVAATDALAEGMWIATFHDDGSLVGGDVRLHVEVRYDAAPHARSAGPTRFVGWTSDMGGYAKLPLFRLQDAPFQARFALDGATGLRHVVVTLRDPDGNAKQTWESTDLATGQGMEMRFGPVAGGTLLLQFDGPTTPTAWSVTLSPVAPMHGRPP